MGWFVWAVVAVVMYAIWSVRAKRVAGLPGPPWLPWFGNLLVMLRHKDDVYEAVLERMHNEKDSGFGVGCRSYAWAMPGGTAMINAHCSEANLRHILKTNFDNYTMPASRVDAFRELFGRGIFAVHGKEWMVQRKAAASIFTMRLMRDSMFDVLCAHGAIFLKKLDALAAAKASADVQDLFFRFTMDSFAEIAFGEDLRCLESEHVHPFSRAFDLVQAGVMDRMMTTPLMWKPMRALGLGREGVIARELKVLNAQAYEFVRHRRADIDAGRERNDLISHFLAAAKKAGEDLSDEQMRDIILNFLVAGRDTTACAMSWTVYELSRHPKVLTQVLAEIDRVIGLHSDGAKPTFESVAELRYFEAVLMETLRLHPSVPVDSKQAIADDVLPDGTKIPAGADVTYNPYTFGRAKCIWGDDALDFKPERWLVAADDTAAGGAPKSPDAKADDDNGLNSGSAVTGGALTKVHNMFRYPTFNAGPRLCLGRGLALMESKLLLSMILQRYTLQVLPDQHITYQVTITLMMKNGMKVTPKPRVFAA